MKMKIRLVAIVATCLTLLMLGQPFDSLCCPNTALAQTGGGYDLTWSTIDGGGGTSNGGAYTLGGTIGQPDAGTLSGGTYTLIGGFWNDALQLLRLYLPVILQ